MKKTIVALYGSSSRGKSTALKTFIHQLKKNKSFDFVKLDDDYSNEKYDVYFPNNDDNDFIQNAIRITNLLVNIKYFSCCSTIFYNEKRSLVWV